MSLYNDGYRAGKPHFLPQLTDEDRTALKSVRRGHRTIASLLQHTGPGFALLAHISPAHRALVEMVPARVRELREIADLANEILKAGECSAEQWDALRWRVKRNAAHTATICDELLGKLRVPAPEPADGGIP
jgi:hypothetical protein